MAREKRAVQRGFLWAEMELVPLAFTPEGHTELGRRWAELGPGLNICASRAASPWDPYVP